MLEQTHRFGCGQGGRGPSGKEFCSLRGMSGWLSDTGTWSQALKAVRDELCGHMEGSVPGRRDRVHRQWSARETARRSGH